VKDAVSRYCREVRDGAFPGGRPDAAGPFHYDMPPQEAALFSAGLTAQGVPVAVCRERHHWHAGLPLPSRVVLPSRQLQQRVAIVGSGALASMLAAALAPHAAVTVVTQSQSRAAALQTEGVRVTDAGGSGGLPAVGGSATVQTLHLPSWPAFRALRQLLRLHLTAKDGGAWRLGVETRGLPVTPSPAAPHPADAHAGAYDVVVLATKATDAVSASLAAACLAAPHAAVLPLWNGGYALEWLVGFFASLHGPDVAEWAHLIRCAAPDEPPVAAPVLEGLAWCHPSQIVGAVTYQAAAGDGAGGVVVHASRNPTLVSHLDDTAFMYIQQGVASWLSPAGGTPAVEAVMHLLQAAGWPVLRLPPAQLPAARMSKAAINSVLNGLAVLTGVANGRVPAVMDAYPGLAAALCHQAAQACSVVARDPGVFAALPPPATLAELTGDAVHDAVVRVAAATSGNTCSTLADLQRGVRGSGRASLVETPLISGWVEEVRWQGLANQHGGEYEGPGVHGRVVTTIQQMQAFLCTEGGDVDRAQYDVAKAELEALMRRG